MIQWEVFVQRFLPGFTESGQELAVMPTLTQIFFLFLISVPLSLLLYLIFYKYKHWMVVDLGDHKWLIK